MNEVKCIYCGWPDWVKDGPDVEKIICGACRHKAELAEMDNRVRQRAIDKKSQNPL